MGKLGCAIWRVRVRTPTTPHTLHISATPQLSRATSSFPSYCPPPAWQHDPWVAAQANPSWSVGCSEPPSTPPQVAGRTDVHVGLLPLARARLNDGTAPQGGADGTSFTASLTPCGCLQLGTDSSRHLLGQWDSPGFVDQWNSGLLCGRMSAIHFLYQSIQKTIITLGIIF